MGVYINLDTGSGFTEQDLKLFRAIAAALEPVAAPAESRPTLAPEAAPAPAEPKDAEPEAAPAPVRRKPGPKPKTAPAPAPEPEPEPEDDVMGEDDEDESATLEQAQAKARELVGEGKTSVVRAALNEIGVKRVGELAPGQAAAFIKALG